jgi:multidrug efflux pump subunit AcrB
MPARLGISSPIGVLILMVRIAARTPILGYVPAAKKERDMGRFEALLDAARGRAWPILTISTAMRIGEFFSSTAHVGRHPVSLPRSGAPATATPAKDQGHAFHA